MAFLDIKYCFHKVINQIPYDFTVWWDSEFETFCGTVSLGGDIVLSTDNRCDTVSQLEFDIRTIIPTHIKEKLSEYETDLINIKPYPVKTKNNIELALEQLFT
jgi:hypothetical protein